MGWNPLDPFKHKKKIKKELGRAAKKAGLDDMLAFEKNQLGYWWDAIKEDPERLFIGAIDPFSSKMWGEVTGKDYEPMLNQLGGPSTGAYIDAAEKGIDVGPSAGSHQVAAAIASWYAGGALGAMAPAAVPVSQTAAAGAVGAGAGAIDAELDPVDLGGLEQSYQAPPSFRVPNVPGFAEGGDVESAPWPDSTAEEDAAYALATQMIDMEFRSDVVRQGGPQLSGFVDPAKARVLGTDSYNVQGLYRPEGAESIMETGRYGPLADELREKGIEAPGPDTVAVVGGEHATEQIWAHEFGHRRDTMEGGGGERYRLIHDAFRSDDPFEWAAAVNRWYAYNERRYRKQGDINNYSQVEKDLKESIASNMDSLIRTEVRAREAEGDIPIGREGMFSIESLDRDQREEMKRRSNSWSIEKYNTAIDKIQNQGKASGGKVVMPSKSPAQAKLMRAAAHGWKKPGGGGPSPSVAREFVAADQAVGMYEGGLAPMHDIVQRGFAPGLNFQEGGNVSWKKLVKQYGGGVKGVFGAMRAVEDGKYFKNEDGTYYAAQPTILQAQEPVEPTFSAGPNRGPRGGRRGGGGRGGRGGGGRGGGGGGGGGGEDETPPRIIPPLVPPVDFTPPDRRAGRDTEYSAALRAHKERLAATLQVPPGGYAEGGAVRPAHAEGPNPYPHNSARYKLWERKNHVDPPPPPPPPPPPEELSWLERIMGKESDRQSRTEEELEEMEQAYGGYVDGYANGGLASAAGGRQPWRGAPPPRAMPGGGRGMPRRGMPPQGMPPGGRGMPRRGPMRGGPPMDPRSMPPQGMPPGGLQQMMQQQQGRFSRAGGRDPRAMPPQGMGFPPGKGPRRMVPPSPPRMTPGVDPRGGPGVVPGGGAGPVGGPRIPSNLRGQMQMRSMMNRPRRGVPGPAGAGGQPNRVGMQDQQGGLARALQKGTGRPPMSRRSGFPGR